MDLSGRAALIVVDMQVGFEDPVWGVRSNPNAEFNISRLLAFWRQTRRPVFHIRHDSPNPTSPLRPRQRGNSFKPQVMPYANEKVIPKTVNSAFIGTSLEADLRKIGSKTIVMTGLTTNHCVSTTARMAADLGFETIVVSDATAAFGHRSVTGRQRPAAEVHETALSDLNGEFATIMEAGVLLEATVGD